MAVKGARPQTPATIATDTIVPLNSFDDSTLNRAAVPMIITLRYDHVLDPNRLRRAFERLTELGEWRKLGARIRLVDDRLKYHIPVKFDESRHGFTFSHVEHGTSIEDHPIASQYPKTTAEPTSYSIHEGLFSLSHRSDAPLTIEGYIYTDEPQLALHIVSFNDATLVSLSWPHTFLDAKGVAEVLKAWTLVLDGREAEVPPICNFDTDPLAELGISPAETYVLARNKLGFWGLCVLLICFFYDQLRWRPERRFVYLPGPLIQRTRDTALRDLTIKQAEQTQQSIPLAKPFVSESDIVCTLMTRLSVRDLRSSSGRIIAIANAIDIRRAVLPSSQGVFLGNALSSAIAIFPAHDILHEPVSLVASHIRNAIVQQTTAGQISAHAAYWLDAAKRAFKIPFFVTALTRLVIFSNWAKLGFFDIDLGPAVQKSLLNEKTTNKLAKPSFVHINMAPAPIVWKESWMVTGKDHQGGYWIVGHLSKPAWDRFDTGLAELGFK